MVTQCRGRWVVPVVLLWSWLAIPGVVQNAQAAPISLSHLNSTVTIDPNSLAGVFDWSVEGTNHIAEQSFWFGVGAGSESDLSVLNVSLQTFLGTQGLQATYSDPRFDVEVRYQLTGDAPGSGHSVLHESVTIRNTGATALDFRLIEEADFDLGGTADGDVVEFLAPSLWRQSDGGFVLSETIATPPPNRIEAALFPFTLAHLLDNQPSLLNNVAGPVGPGDATWASQWSVMLAPGSTFAIDINKEISIPEPATLILVGTGLLTLARLSAVKRREPRNRH